MKKIQPHKSLNRNQEKKNLNPEKPWENYLCLATIEL